jgi:hypothetical protein
MTDLFGHEPPAPTLVQLDRQCDRERPCHNNLAAVHVHHNGVHAAELRCASCNSHRGWVPKVALDFLTTTAKCFGAPTAPIVLRDSTITNGECTMPTKQYDNSGILFRCDNKDSERDRDYRGELTIGGVEYWLSGWIKEGKKGKFLGLAVKPKDAPAADKSKSRSDELNDGIPF